MSYTCPRFPRKGREAILLQGLLPPLCSQVLRLWGVSEGELPECSQWHLASRVLRLRSEPRTSDHTHGSGSNTSLGINEKDTHTFALFATFWPQGWWKPYAWWIRCGWNDANKSRKPYSSVWVSFTFSSNLLLYAASGQKWFNVQLFFCSTQLRAIVEHKMLSVDMFWHKVATWTFHILWSLKKIILDLKYNVHKPEHEIHCLLKTYRSKWHKYN